MTKQLKIILHCICILGVMLFFKGVFICNISGKNWLFTEIKGVLFKGNLSISYVYFRA